MKKMRLFALVSLLLCLLCCTALADAAPAVFYTGNTVAQPGDTVGVRGEYLDQTWTATLTDGTKTANVELIQQGRQSFKVAIPADFAQGTYTLTLAGEKPLTVVFNAPTVSWIQGNEGAIATDGGWLRVQGGNLRVTENVPLTLTLKAADGKETILKAEKVYDDYSVGFAVKGLANGEYAAAYSNGFASCDAGTVTIAAAPMAAYSDKVYNVLEYGVSNEAYSGYTPETNAIQALLDLIAKNGGGVAYFPAGRYHVDGPFHVPSGVTLRGDGYTKTQLFWTDEWSVSGKSKYHTNNVPLPSTELLPDAMFAMESNTAIEDLDFTAFHIGSFFAIGTADAPAENVRIENVRLTCNAQWTGSHWYDQKQAYLAEARTLSILTVNGSNIQIIGCSFDWSGRFAHPDNRISYLLMQNNVIDDFAEADLMDLGTLNCAIVEDFENTGWRMAAGGDNVYIARVNQRDVVSGDDREAFKSHVSEGIAYHGVAVAAEDGLTYTIPADLTNAKPGMSLSIISGTGAGQSAKITKVDGIAVTIEAPFAVAPDAESHVTVNDLFENWIFSDITLDNAGMLQLDGAHSNTVISGVKTTHAAGVKVWGEMTENAVQQKWYTSIVDCDMSKGNYFHVKGMYEGHDNDPSIRKYNEVTRRVPGYSFLYVLGRAPEPLQLACTVRNNSLSDDCVIYVRSAAEGSVTDLILDGNHAKDARCGIYLEGSIAQLTQNDNTAENVTDPVITYESWGVNESQTW